MMLALGAAFLSRTTEYEPEIYSLLFGEVLGVSTTELLPVAGLGIACIAAVVILYRPLMLSSVVPEIAEPRHPRPPHGDGLPTRRGPGHRHDRASSRRTADLQPDDGPPLPPGRSPAGPALRSFCRLSSPCATVWAAIAMSYLCNWPIGFFVGALGAVAYGAGRAWAAWRHTRTTAPAAPAAPQRLAAAVDRT